ncbi:N-acetyl-glucosamine-6-phosphate deacetylase [Tulasnella sp. UAMH 9824]|nr:N-acetyl-glucosamine-6-phosphate deacetylase [Tulasnella sp. UAMH 9824]
MDRLEGLVSAASQLTMYDIKSMYNQAKNVVLNISEMEAKVQEATNDDPWGASSTLMQEIAQGTFNFQQFNEIMPCIYSRFMEKEAKEWRQIYKALQLLEYIIKHGSERVVDDARSHLSTIKMLRNFHYIDDNGKDQGINVRNRSKELAELLQDLDRVRQERRKAKTNRNKYTGVGNDGLSFTSATGSRYGGFGNESYGGGDSGYGGGYDRDYGGSSSRSGGFSDSTGRKTFDEYDAGDDEDRTSAPASSSAAASHQRKDSALSRTSLGSVTIPRKNGESAASKATASSATTAKPPAKVMDLLGFDDEEPAPVTSAAKPAAVASLDDDFDDFQSAPPATATTAPALPTAQPITSAPKGNNVFDLLGGAGPASTKPAFGAQPTASAFAMGATARPAVPAQTQSAFSSFGGIQPQQVHQQVPQQQPMGMGMGMMSPMSPASTTSATAARPNYYSSGIPASKPAGSPAPTSATKSSSGAFDDLWSMGLGKSGSSAGSSSTANAGPAKSIKDLEREKQQAAIWGAQQRPGTQPSMGHMVETFIATIALIYHQVVEFFDMLEFVWNSFTLPAWSTIRTAMIRLPFLPTSLVLPLASNSTTVSPGLGLWPIPSFLSTGSEYVKLSHNFGIVFVGEGRIPQDLEDAMRSTTGLVWNDQFERLLVGRGSVDAKALLNSSMSTLNVLELRLTPGSSNLKSIYEETVGLEALEREESYRLEVPSDASTATLTANSSLGLFRGLTTFTQLFYSSGKTVYTFKAPIVVNDKPAFPHRGILLDTARNFFTKDEIISTIDAMAWSKLNVLHWHVVDSQSFPLQVPAFPELSEKGAYDSKSIYRVEDIKQIVEYAGSHGVDVMVEIDTPGHTTAIAESHPEHVACANAVPWVKYAHEPPAGQLRITSTETIKFTTELFSSVMEMFPSKYFSSGGDEVNFNCYAHDAQSQAELKLSKKTLEKALSSYVEQTHSVITGTGKTPVVWEEMVLRHKINLANDTVTLSVLVLHHSPRLIAQAPPPTYHPIGFGNPHHMQHE